mmetsp:Transcript_29617/g.87348  ORF Transcript_29617/g.87348 Transcript_29617/m.87348 type:complete len:259 (-) Transcript_29617:339-1115(-)
MRASSQAREQATLRASLPRRRLLPLEVRDAHRQQLRHLGTELRLSVHPIRGVRLDVGGHQLVLLECLAQRRRRGELGVRARERHARGEVRLAALVVHLVRRPSLHLEPLQKSSVRLDGLLHVRRERRVEEWAVSPRHFQQGLLELQRLGADRRDVVQRLPVELHVGVPTAAAHRSRQPRLCRASFSGLRRDSLSCARGTASRSARRLWMAILRPGWSSKGRRPASSEVSRLRIAQWSVTNPSSTRKPLARAACAAPNR